MKEKNKGSKIPDKVWLLISFAVAMVLWYLLSLNPKTARSFPNIVVTIKATQTMLERGVFWKDILPENSSFKHCLGGLYGHYNIGKASGRLGIQGQQIPQNHSYCKRNEQPHFVGDFTTFVFFFHSSFPFFLLYEHLRSSPDKPDCYILSTLYWKICYLDSMKFFHTCRTSLPAQKGAYIFI